MTKQKLLELIKQIISEYTGTGASGGNAGDGNNITAPGIPHDDEEAIERYTNKSIYGAEGGQRRGMDGMGPNYGRHPQGMCEQDDEEVLDEDLGTIQNNKTRALTRHAMRGVDIEKVFTRREFQAQRSDLEKPRAELNKAEQEAIRALNKKKMDIQNQTSGGGQQTAEQLVKEYFQSPHSNLMNELDHYKKQVKRSILMEGVMKTFFEKFDKGMTNEEIIQDYASQGTQVPEQFVGNARKQYEGYKKLKLELEMSETDFKNSAKEIVNNPEEAMMENDPEEKQLASGLFKESILKKYITKELKKIKNK